MVPNEGRPVRCNAVHERVNGTVMASHLCFREGLSGGSCRAGVLKQG